MVLRADGHEKRVDTHVFRSERPGFDPCFYGAVFLPFYIPVDLPPATTGANVESRYTFHVICDIPGAIDLETPLAVRLLAPQFLYSAVPPTPAHVPPRPTCRSARRGSTTRRPRRATPAAPTSPSSSAATTAATAA